MNIMEREGAGLSQLMDEWASIAHNHNAFMPTYTQIPEGVFQVFLSIFDGVPENGTHDLIWII